MLPSWFTRCLSFSSLVVHHHLFPLPAFVDDRRTISQDVFDSLEELSRIVDVSYCVGNSGIRKPFQCLSRCDEFQDFELIAVGWIIIIIRSGC